MLKTHLNQILKEDFISFGEVHGVVDLCDVYINIVEAWIKQGRSICVLLEISFDEQGEIDKWMQSGKISKNYLENYRNPSVSAYLSSNYRFLNTLALLNKKSNLIRTICFDMSFDHALDPALSTDHSISKKIQSIKDEDLFDLQREGFMKQKVASHWNKVEEADKTLMICGSMHASKSDYYFARGAEPLKQIETITYWINVRRPVCSIYFAPKKLNNTYQHNGALATKTSVGLNTDLVGATSRLSGPSLISVGELALSEPWKKSFDYLYYVDETKADTCLDLRKALTHHTYLV